MKKPLKFINPLGDGNYERDEIYSWINKALYCIQENQKVIYDLLPEKEVIKKVKPAELTLDICQNCKLKDFQSAMSCDCYCHKPSFTVGPNSTGTQYVTPQTIITSIKN